GTERNGVLMHSDEIVASKFRLGLEHLPDPYGAVAVRPCTRKRIGKIIGGDAVVGGGETAPRGIDRVRDSFNGNEPRPLMRRVPSGTVPPLPDVADWNSPGAMVSNVSFGIGVNNAERGDEPRLSGEAKFGSRLGAVHPQQRGDPSAWR